MSKISESSFVSVGLVIIIVGIAIWLTRLSEALEYLKRDQIRLENFCKARIVKKYYDHREDEQ